MFQDFHIDYGEASGYFHVVTGKKVELDPLWLLIAADVPHCTSDPRE